MSTLTEIEAAVEALPRQQQEELLAFLARRMKQAPAPETATKDSFATVIGAFAGPREATGRNAEEILYGKGA